MHHVGRCTSKKGNPEGKIMTVLYTSFPQMRGIAIAAFALCASAASGQSRTNFLQTNSCSAKLDSPSITIELPGNPFGVAASQDGCWAFVSVDGPQQGIAVLKRNGGTFEVVRTVPAPPAAGIVLTHDGKLLAAAAKNSRTSDDSVLIFDTARLITGAEKPIVAENPIVGKFAGPDKFVGSIYVNVSPDDSLLFVSQEDAGAVMVIDLKRARANGYAPDAILGNIPVGQAPIALTFSPDGKRLYTTSEVAAESWDWPVVCKREGLPQTPQDIAALLEAMEKRLANLRAQLADGNSVFSPAQLQQQITAQTVELEGMKTFAETGKPPIVNPEGAIVVIDVDRAREDPANSVAARIPAGCSAVRMAMSPNGRRVYVTARNNNEALAFDVAKLTSDPQHARVGSSPVGEAPVPVAVIQEGKKIVVGNSNRFAGGTSAQTLSVLDAAKLEKKGADATIGTIRSGAFPREMRVSADGHTLFLTNAQSRSLQVIDIDRLPIESAPKR
jgi:DNA-binding beta-propeller fold protein YncE